MPKNFAPFPRRQFFAVLGGSALLSATAESLLASSSAQTNAPAITPAANTSSGDVIDILIADHRRIEALMNRIAQVPASRPNQRRLLLQQLADLLTVHNSSEENFVYPGIRDIANLPSDAAALYQQQDQAKVLLFELDQLPKSSPNWSARFAAFRSSLLAHVAQEENVDFPRLRQVAGPRLAVITERVRQLRSNWNFND